MTATEQREAVEAHPPMLVKHNLNDKKKYDLREIALWILDNPEQAEYRLSDWWNAPLRKARGDERPSWVEVEAFVGKPVYFLSYDIELAAYRLIAHACRGEVYAPADMKLALMGGAPA